MKTVIAVAASSLVVGLAACSSAEMPTPSVVALPTACTTTAPGAFGLTGVEVGDFAPGGAGAKSIAWSYKGSIPTTGTVIFSWTSGVVQRAVKFDGGQQIANYVFRNDTSQQNNIDAPPVRQVGKISVFVPSGDASALGTSWNATIEVDRQPVGTCSP